MFLPISPDLFFSKNDPEDIRLGDISQNIYFDDLKPEDYVIFGYPDDEGIRLNGGRVGAHEAPKMIRQFLYKMTPSYKKNLFRHKIHDYGDLALTTSDLAMRHEVARKHVSRCMQKKVRTLSFGGGHDYGFADASAFIDCYNNTTEQLPLVINFDAHMDVRPPKNGPHSGTPFYRLYEEHQNKYHFVEIGIQSQCNSPHHVQWALARNMEVFDLDYVETHGLMSLFQKPTFKNSLKNRPVYISFDIDALTASDAGGCSQSWMTGLRLNECLKFLKELYTKTDVRGLGVYEVSPIYDRDFQTSKTAALLAHHFIFNQ